MASFWASRYDVLTFIDCGMHVHRPLAPLLALEKLEGRSKGWEASALHYQLGGVTLERTNTQQRRDRIETISLHKPRGMAKE